MHIGKAPLVYYEYQHNLADVSRIPKLLWELEEAEEKSIQISTVLQVQHGHRVITLIASSKEPLQFYLYVRTTPVQICACVEGLMLGGGEGSVG